MLEDGYVERLDEHNFIRYLVFKIQISTLERQDRPNKPDTVEYTAASTKLIVKFVDYAIALYNYFHGSELTFDQVWPSMEAIWSEDIENKRRRVLISP